MSELRSLAKHCNYGPTLDQILRDRLVCMQNKGRAYPASPVVGRQADTPEGNGDSTGTRGSLQEC